MALKELKTGKSLSPLTLDDSTDPNYTPEGPRLVRKGPLFDPYGRGLYAALDNASRKIVGSRVNPSSRMFGDPSHVTDVELINEDIPGILYTSTRGVETKNGYSVKEGLKDLETMPLHWKNTTIGAPQRPIPYGQKMSRLQPVVVRKNGVLNLANEGGTRRKRTRRTRRHRRKHTRRH